MTLPTIITTATVCGFVLLSCYAYGRADAMRPHPIALRGFDDMQAASKEVVLFKRMSDKAAKRASDVARVLAQVYHVTPENMDADIFGGAE